MTMGRPGPVLIRYLALFLLGGLYWRFVCRIGEAAEPWDTGGYWQLWYPLSLAISALAGFLLRDRRGQPGVLITFAQLPVMWINNGVGPLVAVGVVFLCGLAVPAGLISLLAGRFAPRTHRP
jgi:hypothetical protein